MDAFSLLRYWRSNGTGGDATTNADERTSTATTIVTAVSSQTSETGDEVDEENDNGPFFDLEFSLPAEGGEDELVKVKHAETETGDGYGEEDDDFDGSDELKFTLVSGSSSDCTDDVNVSVSPSDELFFKGNFIPVEITEEVDSKRLQSRVSLMKSATKFRVMMLKFKKSKVKSKLNGESTDSNASNSSNSKEEKSDRNDESEDSASGDVSIPIVSLFKKQNSSKAPKKTQIENESVSVTKETMQKYLKKVKPLYIRVSKRYGEKLKLAGEKFTKPEIVPSPASEEQKHSPTPSPSPAENPKSEIESTSEVSEPPLLLSNVKGFKQGNLPAGLRVVCKQLRKSRSAFTAVAAAPPAAISSNRRDDSLLQQQDGIQSAILHCKKSFKASRDSDCSSGPGSDPVPVEGKCENSLCSEAAEGKEMEEINKR